MLETGLVETQLQDKLYSVFKYYCNKVSLQKWFKSQLIYEHFYIFSVYNRAFTKKKR